MHGTNKERFAPGPVAGGPNDIRAPSLTMQQPT